MSACVSRKVKEGVEVIEVIEPDPNTNRVHIWNFPPHLVDSVVAGLSKVDRGDQICEPVATHLVAGR